MTLKVSFDAADFIPLKFHVQKKSPLSERKNGLVKHSCREIRGMTNLDPPYSSRQQNLIG